jgi:hypothetical protein
MRELSSFLLPSILGLCEGRLKSKIALIWNKVNWNSGIKTKDICDTDDAFGNLARP